MRLFVCLYNRIMLRALCLQRIFSCTFHQARSTAFEVTVFAVLQHEIVLLHQEYGALYFLLEYSNTELNITIKKP